MRYVRIDTQQALIDALRRPDAAILCGGTDLLIRIRNKQVRPAVLLDVSGIAALRGVSRRDECVEIGAATPVAEILASPIVSSVLPLLATVLYTLGSVQIRNRASLGGNLVNASPAADSAVPLLLHDALVHVAGADGNRDVPIQRFLVGPGRTSLQPGEFVQSVRVPLPPQGCKGFFHKVGKRRALTIAIASVGALLCVENGVIGEARFAAGSVAPTAIRLSEVETLVAGRPLEPDLVHQAVETARAAISPIDDIRATAAYRRAVVGDLVARALQHAGAGPILS